MTNAFVAGIAATLASETAAGNIPVPPFKVTYSPDYGSDISCTSDTDAMFTEIAGDDPNIVAQWCWRILISDRDSIPDAEGLGFDIMSLVRRGATPAEIASWPVQIKAAISDDDRITALVVKVSSNTGGQSYTVAISGETATGPFSLTGLLTPDAAILQEIFPS